MEILGFTLPLWTVFAGIIVIAVIAWKLIKFAIKALLVIILLFLIMMGLDFLNVFDMIQNLLTSLI